MLIVCANLSNLLLARTAARQKEIAIRTALGAGRGRLVAQVLTEGIVLSCSGATLGIVIALVGTRALAHLDAVNVPLLASVRTDATSLAFTLVLAVVTGIVFGLAPAFNAPESTLHDALKDASRGSTTHHAWLRNALVIAEIAFACVLVVGAGLLVRSFVRVLDIDLGFRPAHAVTVRVDPDTSYPTREKQLAYLGEVLRLVRSVLTDATAVTAIRGALAPIVHNIGGNEFRPVQALVDRSVSPRRFMVLMLGAFAAFALVLASLGIYALIAYSVSQRTQEIGIRMALGASAAHVQARILAQTLTLAFAGMAIGAIASWLLGRSVSGLLYGVTPGDPVTFAAMLIVLTLVAALAGWLPARRASRIDPLVALRSE
jgi:predicted lysophospholipase L1 biosynthesis ABC-type transport system permease subunit